MSKAAEILQQWNCAGNDSWQITAAGIRELEIYPAMQYADFFQSLHKLICAALQYSELVLPAENLADISLPDLERANQAYFTDLKPASYEISFGNPDHAVRLYGTELGQLMTVIYSQFRPYLQCILQQRYSELTKLNKLFLILYNHALSDKAEYLHWLDLIRLIIMEDLDKQLLFNLYWRYSPEKTCYKDILMQADLSDPRYLYQYGVYLSKHDLAMAEYMTSYPEAELKSLSGYIVQSFVDGFTRGMRDYKIKKYVSLSMPIGMERLGRMLVEDLFSIGLYAIVHLPQSSSINKQFGYDHRFDNALHLDQLYVDRGLEYYERAVNHMADTIRLNAGTIYVDLFGETPFSPVSKASALKLSDPQMQLSRKYSAQTSQMFYKHYKAEESSFCIIAFPSPEIGTAFREIFADTVKINLLDSIRYGNIQQKIIDVLDTAEYVHIKGKPGNDTDIRVKLHPLKDPDHETNFENCVADVNIPVGEVFTSPLLTGTNGTLHVEDIYLRGLRFFNIKITFKDGWVHSYSCTNFDNPEDGKKYIEENLLMPHKSLPIGEFAIGTNTTAYQIAKKHDILALLPILIIEKMGPHFAIGDTCYSHEEDFDHFNFVNGKKIIAVDNEKSATRHADPLGAYMQAHTDITLPYEMLESISAVRADGTRTDIIRDGFFTVPGTEELNIPLQEMLNK